MPGAVVAESLRIVINLRQRIFADFRIEAEIAIFAFEDVNTEFIVRVFDVKGLTAACGAFHIFHLVSPLSAIGLFRHFLTVNMRLQFIVELPSMAIFNLAPSIFKWLVVAGTTRKARGNPRAFLIVTRVGV
jgi:hypothetical protein